MIFGIWTNFGRGGGDAQKIFDEYIIGKNNRQCWYNIYKKAAGSSFLVQNFFEEQVEPFLGIDIYDSVFDRGKGYSILKYGNIDIFIYQVEKIAETYSKLADFLGAEDKDCGLNVNMLENSWLGNQWYGKEYQRAKETLVLSKEYFDNCYSSKYIKHFYSDADIEAFMNRWKHNVR